MLISYIFTIILYVNYLDIYTYSNMFDYSP